MAYRHLAKDANNQQLLVVFMQIEGQPEKSLVIRTEELPLPLRRAVISILESPEGQSISVFADILGRRVYADSGKTFLQVLHEGKFLHSKSIDEVLMTPVGNMTIPLRNVLTQMGKIINHEQVQQSETSGFNPFQNNMNIVENEETIGIARNLLIEAEMLEGDAHTKRQKAYSMAPSLKPNISIDNIQDAVKAGVEELKNS